MPGMQKFSPLLCKQTLVRLDLTHILASLITFSSDEIVPDGQKLSVTSRELGNTEVYAQTLQHSPNGR